MALSFAFGAVGVFGDDEGDATPQSAWSYDSSTGKTTAINSNGMWYANVADGMYLADGKTATGDYTISTTFVGTAGITSAARHDVGLFAYYHDANNWISFSVSWWNGFSDGKVTDLLIAECNGGVLSYYDHYFDNPTYNYGDITASYNKVQTDSITLSVSKEYDVENKYDVYTFYVDGNEFVSKNFGLSASASVKNDSSKFGYVCFASDSTFTFDEITVSSPGPDGSPVSYADVTGAPEGTKGVGSWAYNSGAYSTTATDTGVYQNHVIAANSLKSGNYKVGYSVELSNVNENSQVLLSGWYAGKNDKMLYIVKKTANGYTVEQNGVLSGSAIENGEAKAITANDNVINLTIEKSGWKVTLKQDDNVLFTYTSDALDAGTDILFGAGNVTATITPTVTELPYVAYDFYKTTISNVEYTVSAKDKQSVKVTDTGITMNAEADNVTRIIYASGTSGYIDLSATFAGATTYGMYVYYMNEQNNVLVEVNGANVALIVTASGTKTTENFTATDAVSTLTAKLRGKDLSVYSGDTAIFENKEVASIDIVNTFKIGFTAKDGNATVSNINKVGFVANTDRIDGDYILKGPSYSTWQLEGETLKGDCTNGTAWTATNAYKQIDKMPIEGGYSIGFAAQVVGKANTEWKYGVIPFCVGADFIMVWISQQADAGVEIVATGWFNGAAWGETFRYVGVSLNITELNLVEVRVEGDTVSVYLNKSYAPAFSTTFEGLSAIERKDSEGKDKASYMGFNIFNTSTNFSQITYQNNLDSRIFADTEAPDVQTIGTMPTTAKVGEEVRLATFISSDSSATVTVECTLNGENVKIEKNRFTADKAGEYVVKVTATDLWGNSDTQEYKITVTESKKSGCGGAVLASSALISALAVAFAGVSLKKKSR